MEYKDYNKIIKQNKLVFQFDNYLNIIKNAYISVNKKVQSNEYIQVIFLNYQDNGVVFGTKDIESKSKKTQDICESEKQQFRWIFYDCNHYIPKDDLKEYNAYKKRVLNSLEAKHHFFLKYVENMDNKNESKYFDIINRKPFVDDFVSSIGSSEKEVQKNNDTINIDNALTSYLAVIIR